MVDPIPFTRAKKEGYVAPAVDPPSGGGDDGGMDARLRTVEQSVARIDATLSTLATKSDMAELRADIHKSISEGHRWTHGAVVGMFTVAVLGVIGLLVTIWNAGKAPITPAQPPIIINIPGQLQGSTQGGGAISPVQK